MTTPNVAAAPEDAPDPHCLGLDVTDADLLRIAEGESEIVKERQARAHPGQGRRRAGPLPVEQRPEIVSEATASLRRALLALILATDGLPEIAGALARVGLELRRYQPGLDGLAASLQKDL